MTAGPAARRPNPARCRARTTTLLTNLHFASRRLIDMTIEHADLDALIDLLVGAQPLDELLFKRLKKRRLLLRDQIAQIEYALRPAEPA